MTYWIDPDKLGYGIRVMYGVNIDPPWFPEPTLPKQDWIWRWVVNGQVTIDRVENGYIVTDKGKRSVCESFDSLVVMLRSILEVTNG